MVQFLYDNRTASATCLVETRLGETCFVFLAGASGLATCHHAQSVTRGQMQAVGRAAQGARSSFT